MRKIEPELREEMKKTYVGKLMNVIRIKGFNSLKIQDMAKYMQISKASLYNYFSSKEEIIQEITQTYIVYFEEVDQAILNNELTYIDRFQKVFEQEVLTFIYISELFLEELKVGFPDLYDGIISARRKRKENIRQFYEVGLKEGVFNELNPSIFIVQDEVMLRKLLDPAFLLAEGLTIKQVLKDYYQAKKIQVFKADKLTTMNDDSKIMEKIEYLTRKLSNSYS
ncbi:TetR/AcrR family transcriptional regulator [Chengkuizengella axinellae]|uniref:TetR/AcrR family transcriptional regulator n=1 Tax=Chengkuizengella axinellae TaxID=3064388 RepID=A0ABT9J5G0_9BACL|nr:TetR/AcrR family transcriptional regulator [Chengkuizengella sp. 2205SS18-9]MDP5276240.1 TetR/AcrR family transcriptional regulator [Chengkuizengella sp. 2205SS18-9]